MPILFWIQFRALVWKNWIVLSKHPFSTLLRCLILPIAYGLFLSFAQGFLHRLNNYGMGSTQAIASLRDHFDGTSALFWVDSTTVSTNPTPADIIAHITSNFTKTQLSAVRRVNTTTDIVTTCRQNFNGLSTCFAGLSFTDVLSPYPDTNPLNYTILADAGLIHIDVEHHSSDFEGRIFPLQWAIDQAIIELRTGLPQTTPIQWPFTMQSNKDQLEKIRLSYCRGIREIVVLAFFLAFSAIAYQIAGSVANERSLLITGHMKAMGLYDSARILSWHISISLTYLPGWIIVGLIWKFRIFVKTDAGLVVFLHILLGLVLASWSFFVAAPFGKSPQLAAVVTTFLAAAIAVVAQSLDPSNEFGAVMFSLLFPPSFYIFSIKAICGFENHLMPTDAFQADPDRNIVLFSFILIAIIDIFLWPCLAVLLERYLYETISPKSVEKSQKAGPTYLPPNVAISIRNLTKTYSTSLFGSKGNVTAVSNLNLDIPKTGIFVLLGSNGAGKSTTLSILAGLSSITSGTVTFEGGCARPARGTMGIVPQKNVLFAELTCLQTLEVWKAVKWSPNSDEHEDLEQLLIDCDLEKKIHANASTLSGGQKRKLQLAIGLLGGSKLVLVDECTSGVDPLSRRALWKILSALREDRGIVFTTHFLDEADLLADHIAILAAPGKVLASGSPVSLKRDLGEGYSVQVDLDFSLDSGGRATEYGLLQKIKSYAPQAYVTSPSLSQACYHLKTKNNQVVGDVLRYLDAEAIAGRIASYDILGTTIEDIFLKLMSENDGNVLKKTFVDDGNFMEDITCDTPLLEKASSNGLATGRPVSPFRQALTIFHKRVLIARRGWLTPFLAVFITVLGACIPLVFIKGRNQSCTVPPQNLTAIPLYLPISTPILTSSYPNNALVVASPPKIVNTLGHMNASHLFIMNVADNETFYSTINTNYRHITTGGVSIDDWTGASTIAWEATSPGLRGLSMLNLATNLLLDRARNVMGTKNSTTQSDIIYSNYSTFPKVASATLVYLKWLFFFGAVMAVYPAFFALYVSKERRSSIQAMQLSNGLTNPIGMWLGHLLFDLIPATLLSTIIIIVFSSFSGQFHGLGILWIIFLLYGISGTLFAYCLSLMVNSPLAAFAIVACYQFIVFILYLSSYLAVFTFGKITETSRLTTIIHFTTSFFAPITSVVRATLVSTNLFSLLCDSGNDSVTTTSMLSITKFGGPILYLFVYIFALLGILAYVDSGSKVRRLKQKKTYILGSDIGGSHPGSDVISAADAVQKSDDLLRVMNLSKSYNGKRVADDVSLGVPRDSIFALLGPNGAGKTTTFNIIQGEVYPDSGDVIINGHSIVSDPQRARQSLGVCPQFTAIDSHLTVREHLTIYGRLKGLKRGPELDESVETILKSTALTVYADRLASKLSGGNQRKLALGIALMGNPSVILIDEFSTGVDPKMKRDMWHTLRKVSVGKAIIITTHSMEEASALANNVGILSKRMLAVGMIDDLSARYATYEVHFSCRSRTDVVRALDAMSLIPGSRKMDDVATRFEVPVDGVGELSLARVFNTLAALDTFEVRSGAFGRGRGRGASPGAGNRTEGGGRYATSEGESMPSLEYTVERASLESVFLKVVRGHGATASVESKKDGWFQHRTLPSESSASRPVVGMQMTTRTGTGTGTRSRAMDGFVPLRRTPSW